MAIALSYIPIDPADVPVRFIVRLSERVRVQLTIRYNSVGDYYTADIAAADGTPLVYGRKLMVGQDLLEGIFHDSLPPGTAIVPADWSGLHLHVNQTSFMRHIKPWVVASA